MRKRRIIVMGFMASCPIAGVVWQHLHYIVGLQRLGHDVYYVEDSARYPYNPQNFATSEDCTHAVQTLHDLAQAFSFGSRWAYCARFLDPPQCFGMHLRRLRQLYTEADAVLNICGAQELHEDLLKNQHLIYVESDPGVEQIYVDLGDEKALTYLGHHQTLFTFGENIGSNSFPVPLHGLRWLPTRQPVVIDFWETESAPAKNAVFSTIANWSTRGKKDVRWKGKNYLWSKTENFLHFIRAPEIASATFEIATEMRDEVVAEEFVARGWRLVSPTRSH